MGIEYGQSLAVGMEVMDFFSRVQDDHWQRHWSGSPSRWNRIHLDIDPNDEIESGEGGLGWRRTNFLGSSIEWQIDSLVVNTRVVAALLSKSFLD